MIKLSSTNFEIYYQTDMLVVTHNDNIMKFKDPLFNQEWVNGFSDIILDPELNDTLLFDIDRQHYNCMGQVLDDNWTKMDLLWPDRLLECLLELEVVCKTEI